jgi:aspartate dehydrogenase
MKIGVIGCGAIGRVIAVAMDRTESIGAIFLFDRSEEAARSLSARLDKAVHVTSIDVLIKNSELVVEAASQEAVSEFVPQVLWAGRDVMLMSVGAFADDKLADHLKRIAREKRCHIYIPTGAIAGVDGVRCAAEGRIDEVTLETRKPPRALEGNETVTSMGIDLKTLSEERVIFDGTAREAVRGFPQNINVAAALSLAGVGFDETKVRIIADPKISTNQHTIHLKGSFGEMRSWVSNYPCPDNAKTSYLSALAAISMVRKIASGFWVGS